MAITAAMRTQVTQLYVSLFGRAPEADGLGFWVKQLDAGQSVTQIANSMYAVPAARTYYPEFLTNSEIIAKFYTNVLGRTADAEGQAFWLAKLDAKGATPGAVISEMINVVANYTGTDAAGIKSAALFNNKVDVGLHYAVTTLGNSVTNTALAGVTDEAATVTAAKAAISGGTPAVGQTFTLTTSVDAVSGGAGNDAISGLIGSTFTVGDNINGGSGSDTLNLIDSVGTAAPFASLTSVETVNVRTLVASGTDVTELNAAEWVGVTTLTNASSLADSELQFSGLATTTQVVLHGNTDISGNFANTTTADISIAAVNAGSFAGVTTYGVTGVTAAATAAFSLDGAAAGTISGVTIALSGNNLLKVDAGATADSFTITGNGSAVLFTDNRIATADASAFTGNLDLQLDGISEVVVKGGAGNDTLRLGTNLSNSDSFDGGAGTDTIRATVAGFTRNLNTTNVESAILTFSEAAGGDVNASASTVTSYTFAAGTAGNAASVSQIANGATITLNDDDLGDVTLDYASGALTTVINIGSVSGTVTVATAAFSDVATVTINSVGATAGATIGTATFDADVKAINITTSGSEADLTIGTTNTDGSLGGATSLTVTSNGSAAVTFNAIDFGGSAALRTISLSANGTDAADITLGDVSGSALTTVSLTAVSGADITVGTLDLGNDASGGTQDETISITQGSNSNVTVGAISVSGQGTININVTQQATGIADIAQITLLKSTEATADEVGKNITFGAITVAASGEVAINGIDMAGAGSGAQVTFGDVVVSQDGGYSAGHISGSGVNIDVSSFTISVGASATATFGNIVGLSAGAVGARTLTLLSDATATFGTVTASAISTHSIIANTGASANFGAMTSEGAVGAFAIGGVDGADVEFGAVGASGAIGAISVSGALNVTFGTMTATRIGEVNNTQQGVSGAFTIDLSGVTTAVEVKLGAAANTVISGDGRDAITLTTGTTGNDLIRYNTAIAAGTDEINGFFAGSTGLDRIELVSAGFGVSGAFRDADGVALSDASTVVFGTAISAAATLGTTGNVLVFATGFASTGALATFIASAGAITFATADMDGSGNFIALYTDLAGTDTYVALIHFDSGAAAQATLASAADITVTNLSVIKGVSPGAMVAANIDIV